MKKGILIFGFIFLGVLIFLPIGVIVFFHFGYIFDLTNYSIFGIITALLAIVITILSVLKKKLIDNKEIKILFSLTAPLSLLNSFFYFSKSSDKFVILSMVVCVYCCIFLMIKFGGPWVLKLICMVFSGFMALPFLFSLFVLSIFGDISQDTIIESVASPNGTYLAEIIDNDQGALGGNTYVEVYENVGINTLIFHISAKSQVIYKGRWEEFKTMEIYWKNDHCLVINSVEYPVE